MQPDELRKLMHRFRVSSDKLGKAIGVHPVTVRRWRSGARHPGRDDTHRIMAFFRDLGGEPMPTIDPAQIVPVPTEHRISIKPRVIEPRVDPLPRPRGAAPAKASIVEAINALVAVLAPRPATDPIARPAEPPAVPPQSVTTSPRDQRSPPARPIVQPSTTQQPQIIDAMPLGPPPEPFSAPRGPRCRWPHTAIPGAPSSPCEQLAAPGLPYCALHWMQHVQHRQRFG